VFMIYTGIDYAVIEKERSALEDSVTAVYWVCQDPVNMAEDGCADRYPSTSVNKRL
jgi:hypothetical protein